MNPPPGGHTRPRGDFQVGVIGSIAAIKNEPLNQRRFQNTDFFPQGFLRFIAQRGGVRFNVVRISIMREDTVSLDRFIQVSGLGIGDFVFNIVTAVITYGNEPLAISAIVSCGGINRQVFKTSNNRVGCQIQSHFGGVKRLLSLALRVGRFEIQRSHLQGAHGKGRQHRHDE